MTHEDRNSSFDESLKTTRRTLLRGGAGAIGAFSLLAMGSRGAQAAKVSQSAVQYQWSPNGNQKCATCRMFVAPNACKQVEGAISPNGWCRIWKKA
jgi:hypothetical protein